MDDDSLEPLALRLVSDPQDGEALAAAYEVGTQDPKRYAEFLENVAERSSEGSIASHWFTEAATVWSASLSDAPSAARALMSAVERDPTAEAPAERLAEMYREKGDTKALIALLERRAKGLDPLAENDSSLKAAAASVHRQLGRLWGEAPLSQHPKAIENYRRAMEFNDQSLSTISSLRELFRADNRSSEALPYYAKEQQLLSDPERKIALYLEEAEVRREAKDLPAVAQALRAARLLEGGTDPSLKQQLGAVILERAQLGEGVSPGERAEAVQLFVELAEEFPGEHGYSYSACALELAPDHERAVQLVMFYGAELGQDDDVAPRAAEYLRTNPDGLMSAEAQALVARVLGEATAEVCVSEGRAQVAARAIGADITGTGGSGAVAPAPASGGGNESGAREAREAKDLSVVVQLLEEGQTLARKARKHEAAAKYQSALQHDPASSEAIAFLQGYWRQTRKFKELREMLVNASRGAPAESPSRLEWLREVAALSETQLKDVETAIWAWSQISVLAPEDEQAAAQLMQLMEKAARWDDLASLLEQRAELMSDLEARLVIEKKAAKIHEDKRQDLVAAGSVWARIATLSPDDELAIATALKHFAAAKRPDLGAQVLTEMVSSVASEAARAKLLSKLGGLREELGEAEAAGDAFTEAGVLSAAPEDFSAAERCYVRAEAWNQAATSVGSRLDKEEKPSRRAELLAQEAVYLAKAGDRGESLIRLERAVEEDPTASGPAEQLEEAYRTDGRLEDIVTVLLQRADTVKDTALKVNLRKRAASVQRGELNDVEGSRDTLGMILQDAEDVGVLEQLASDEIEQGNWAEAAQYLHRQAASESDPAIKVSTSMREAAILANQLGDRAGAIERYEHLLAQLDPRNQEALRRIADLKQEEGDHEGVAKTLEVLLPLISDNAAKLEVANRLADLYEETLDFPKEALVVLNVVRELDPEDFSAVQRLCSLSERLSDWAAVAKHMVDLIEVEGDEQEISLMTRRRASILNDRLGRADEALAALKAVAATGDEGCRDEFIALGDKLGREAEVAQALLDWYRGAAQSPKRQAALRGAFDRFLALGNTVELANVAEDLVGSGGATTEIASKLEELAATAQNLGAVASAQKFLVKDLSGPSRAEEMVRQAGVLRKAGVESAQCLEHGEQALTSVAPGDIEPLLQRLAEYCETPDQVVDIYEHQVMRCKEPRDRLQALARAAQVAAQKGKLDRARQLFEVALGAAVEEASLELLVGAARDADAGAKEAAVVKLLAEVLAAGGQSARDGGRQRSRFLARAAHLAASELGDSEQAFTWMGDALVAHVDDERISDLLTLAKADLKRADAVIERTLQEVFDGPHVRLLLARRAKLRREELADIEGSGLDLKRLHELAPADQEVSDALIQLYQETRNSVGLVRLYEDLILRGKDKEVRAELSKKVANLWDAELNDPREAADAWRRVLRLKPNDPEGTQGLERAKHNMLHSKAPADDEQEPDEVAPAPVPVLKAVAPAPVLEEVAPESMLPEPILEEALAPESMLPEPILEEALAADSVLPEPILEEALPVQKTESPVVASEATTEVGREILGSSDHDSLADELSAVFRHIQDPNVPPELVPAPNLDSRIQIDLASSALAYETEQSVEASVRSVLDSEAEGSLGDLAYQNTAAFRASAPSSEEIEVDIDVEDEAEAKPPVPTPTRSRPPKPPPSRSGAPPARQLSPPPRPQDAKRAVSDRAGLPPSVPAIPLDDSAEDALDLDDEELLEGPST